MKNNSIQILALFLVSSFISCSQNSATAEIQEEALKVEKTQVKKSQPHQYGGWFCPDNLNGFPAVDISNWKSVPVVNGRLATREETQNGTSLIFVDLEQYPEAKPLDIEMPKLARFYNAHSKKEELVIVIQAINVSNDSVVGFRYLNGGNGSANFSAVRILSDEEIESISSSRFVSFNLNINATQTEIWKVLTQPEYAFILQPIFDEGNTLGVKWVASTKVNYKYVNGGEITSEFAESLFGNQYIQIDYKSEDNNYVEKFLLLEDEETNITELKIACGPYKDDFNQQKEILEKWAQKVKELSEAG